MSPNSLGRVGVSDVVKHASTGLLLVLCVAGCSSSSHHASTPTARAIASTSPTLSEPPVIDVPWIDRAAPRPVSLTRPLPIANARPCTGSDLSPRVESSQGAGQTTLVISYVLTNVSRTTCSLGGFPTSVVATEPGLPPVTASHTRFKEGLPPGNIAPSKFGILTVYAPLCASSAQPPATIPTRPYHRLVVSLPAGGQTVVNGALDLSCGGFSVDPLGVRQPVLRAWYSPLTIEVTIPAAVDAGTTLSYVVTLVNPMSGPIRISPCPGYIESARGKGINIVETYALNCNGLREIPAAGRIRYGMRMHISNDTPTGDAVVSWTLAEPEAPIGVRKLLHIRRAAVVAH